MMNLETYVRTTRAIPVVHAEAFQLMLYREKVEPGSKPGEEPFLQRELWIWNSRDGVTPFGLTVDGIEYLHAMNVYRPRYTAALPDRADHVFVDYDREAWAAMLRDRWQRMTDHPKSEWHDPAQFKERFPTAESFVDVDPYRSGEPRRITREQFLATTSSWMGRHIAADELVEGV